MNKYKLLITSTLVVGLLAGCGGGPMSMAMEEQEAVAVQISVETKEIKPESIQEYTTISSKIDAESQVSVVSQVSGTVKKVNFKVGDTVKAGDILFEIDDTDSRIQVNQAQASLTSAEANYQMNAVTSVDTQIKQIENNIESLELQLADLLKDLEQKQSLYEIGAGTKNEIDTIQSSIDSLELQIKTEKDNLEKNKNEIAQATIGTAQAQITQAEASLESATVQLDRTKVRAEVGGVISERNINVGDTVSQQATAMTIVNINNVKVTLNVSDEVINRIKIGGKVNVTLSAIPNETFIGTIDTIAPVADSQTMLYKIEASLDNSNGEIKAGMFASVQLVLEERQEVASLPLNAVIEKNDEKYVFVVDENNVAQKTIVETGIKNDKNIEILSGVENGQQVVVVGQDFISHGTSVNITAQN
ncbi:MAG: efflux RND transporter periplasmic adaptor subunit [Anaerotignaceae bacterium]